jgi:hypothetical protein
MPELTKFLHAVSHIGYSFVVEALSLLTKEGP